MRNFFKNTYLAFIFLLLYTPVLVLILFSFNASDSIRNFGGFSLDAYRELAQQTPLWSSVGVTIITAIVSTIISTIIGTMAALGLSKTKRLTQNLTLTITNIPLINADVVTAVSLMLLFVGFNFTFGLGTLILAHISFNIPYVIVTVLPRLYTIEASQLEASADLGAPSWYTLKRVVLPNLKPSIISGAAIAFAMSFDDFLISYFTGGSSENLSAYIYSLKQIKPYINAFATIIIVIIALIIISWNTYRFVYNTITSRNFKITAGTFHLSKFNKIDKQILRHYQQLNNFKVKKMTKRNTIDLKALIEKNKALDIEKVQIHLEKNSKLVHKIQVLENKILKQLEWIDNKKKQLAIKKRKKESHFAKQIKKHRYRWWNNAAKALTWFVVIGGALIGTGFYYHLTNSYDLLVANWGNYMTPEIQQRFYQETGIRVKYANFSDNESLYAKSFTTNYDVMVPSDYMVARMALENKILELDPQQLHHSAVNQDLLAKLEGYDFTLKTGDRKNLWNYCRPYFWGDGVLVINEKRNPDIINDLGLNLDTNKNFGILKKAAAAVHENGTKKYKIVLNDDMHNLFMLGLSTLHFENYWKENTGTGTFGQENNTFYDYVNPHRTTEIDDVIDWLEPLIKAPNTSLLNDDIIDVIADPNKFDIAFLYNGDLLSGMLQNRTITPEHPYTFIRPYTGTSLWADCMIINKDCQNIKAAYAFMNFMLRDDIQTELSKKLRYTATIENALQAVKASLSATVFQNIYQPSDQQIANPYQGPDSKNYNGLYRSEFDSYMQARYSQLLAR